MRHILVTDYLMSLKSAIDSSRSETVIGIPSQLDSIAATQETAELAHIEIFNEQIQQTRTLGVVENGIKHVDRTTAIIQEAVRTASLTSEASHLRTQVMLEQILQQFTTFSPGDRSSSRVIEEGDESMTGSLQDEETSPVENKPCQGLASLISRVCSLVDDNQLQGRVASGEARDILSNLLQALEQMKSEQFLYAEVHSALFERICSTCRRRHLDDLGESLTSIYAALLSTWQVAVNTVGKASHYSRKS